MLFAGNKLLILSDKIRCGGFVKSVINKMQYQVVHFEENVTSV